MNKVKNTFFLQEKDIESIREEQKNPYLTFDLPCYELEDGTILYGQSGYPASRDIWWGSKNKFK